MKINRQKKVQRILTFYRNHFGFRPPFQILIDATFCQAALKFKIDINKQLRSYIGPELRLFTTVCVVNEVEMLGPALYGAMLVVKQFPVRKCSHEKSPIAAVKCLQSLISSTEGNADHLIVATQDAALSATIRSTSGVPLIYISHNTIILEKESEASRYAATSNLVAKSSNAEDPQIQVIKQLKRSQGLEDDEPTKVLKKKRKGPKGPNPLSCKKKKKTVKITVKKGAK